MTILAHRDYRKLEEHQAEIVVIGTGAGGAVVGAELAEAGRDVLFLEEGGYHPTSSFNPYLTESLPRLYRDAGGTIIMGRPPIPFAEGRCVGGSTVVNGGMAWRPPETVLADWERITRQPDLGLKAMEPLLERVEERIHAKPQHASSIGEDSRLLEEGARRLGWDYAHNRRAQDRCVGSNQCLTGCPTGAKQSTLLSYMPRALSTGARCLTEVRAQRLWIERGRCVGVFGKAINPRTREEDVDVRVRAKAVVVACGAIQTPFLLLGHRDGRPSKQLGKNFLCHPNAKVIAIYPDPIYAWQGVSQGGQIREFRNEGILMAENAVPPGTTAAQIPFLGQEALDLMKRYDSMVMTGVLVEDSHSGTVARRFGGPMARYSITRYDHARFLRGVQHLATLHFEMGAERVILPFSNFHIARHVDELAGIERSQGSRSTIELFTVHMMGTCRMGSRPSHSVVNLSGEVWDLPGCYVADASLFPTAVGVNPQVTIMALATRVAQRLQVPN
ncbi:MAG TPA: GMC family oxidoreductase [Polyangiales bacterium]|nr:GMC family oxidoreductase [Polyangiales bacterium]